MTGDLLDRLERELVDGMRRYQAHPRRAALRAHRLWHPGAATLAVATAALIATALLSLSTLWFARDEERSASRGTAAAPPAHIVDRNWKPVIPDVDVFQLTLSDTAWTAVPGAQHARKHGHLRWSGRHMIVSADPPCTVTGVYQIDLAENRLTLTAEDDRCEQRRDLLERRWLALP